MTTLRNYLQQSQCAEAVISAEVKRLMPAFPKPHLYKLEGAWYCTRHLVQDEFFTAQGLTPKAAFYGGDRSVDLETIMRDAPTWLEHT